jgi:protein SCO1/2
MQKVAVLAAVLLVVACAKAKAEKKPLSEPGEKVYAVRGVIVGRDAEDNTLRLDHEEIRGYMEAMTMDYPVRGATVGALPADKTRVTGTLHVHDDRVWLTDVRRAQ